MKDFLPQGTEIPAVLHELRTWVSAVGGWTRILRLRGTNGGADGALVGLERAALAMERFVIDLELLSRGAATPFHLRLEHMNLLTVVDTAVEMMRPNAELKGITLVQRADRKCLPTVCGDPLRVQQIVCNVLTNALKFTPRDGRVLTTVQTRAGVARIAIEDSGPGISPTFLPAVFDAFSQDPAVRHAEGSGLGLAVAKTLAELHSGTIEVEAGGNGHGATFCIVLPLASQV
jgi:signal transduction histidine kinase